MVHTTNKQTRRLLAKMSAFEVWQCIDIDRDERLRENIAKKLSKLTGTDEYERDMYVLMMAKSYLQNGDALDFWGIESTSVVGVVDEVSSVYYEEKEEDESGRGSEGDKVQAEGEDVMISRLSKPLILSSTSSPSLPLPQPYIRNHYTLNYRKLRARLSAFEEWQNIIPEKSMIMRELLCKKLTSIRNIAELNEELAVMKTLGRYIQTSDCCDFWDVDIRPVDSIDISRFPDMLTPQYKTNIHLSIPNIYLDPNGDEATIDDDEEEEISMGQRQYSSTNNNSSSYNNCFDLPNYIGSPLILS